MLKEDDKIIDYWNKAAKGDALRETVSQWGDESDEDYLRRWVEEGEYVAAKIMLHAPANPVALEIGPGMGRITVPMSKRCRSITALDISPEMVLKTRETLRGLLNFEAKIITDEDLSFVNSESFDLVYSIGCFQHAEKKTFYRYLVAFAGL